MYYGIPFLNSSYLYRYLARLFALPYVVGRVQGNHDILIELRCNNEIYSHSFWRAIKCRDERYACCYGSEIDVNISQMQCKQCRECLTYLFKNVRIACNGFFCL